jgi:uncharacterized protein
MTENTPSDSGDIEVKIYSLATMMTESIIFLEETHGNRLLPIWIGLVEGQAIAIKFSGIVLPRPMTHDLILSIIKNAELSVEKIVINEIRDNTFYALIHLRKNGSRFTIDSRPSDALAVAVRAGCPIYVSSSIFLKAQVLSKPISEEELQKFKEELKDLKPKDIYNQLLKETGEETHKPETGQNDDTEGRDK